jgi:alpha-ketoglutarate-dependent taurine dioxygenase
MYVETRPLGGSFACEVLGLRLWDPLHDGIVHRLRDLWAHNPVLVFRRQALAERELAEFSALRTARTRCPYRVGFRRRTGNRPHLKS